MFLLLLDTRPISPASPFKLWKSFTLRLGTEAFHLKSPSHRRGAAVKCHSLLHERSRFLIWRGPLIDATSADYISPHRLLGTAAFIIKTEYQCQNGAVGFAFIDEAFILCKIQPIISAALALAGVVLKACRASFIIFFLFKYFTLYILLIIFSVRGALYLRLTWEEILAGLPIFLLFSSLFCCSQSAHEKCLPFAAFIITWILRAEISISSIMWPTACATCGAADKRSFHSRSAYFVSIVIVSGFNRHITIVSAYIHALLPVASIFSSTPWRRWRMIDDDFGIIIAFARKLISAKTLAYRRCNHL